MPGAAVQWLRDTLGVIESAADTQDLAGRANQELGVYFFPALVGLGAPHWDSQARGAIVGLTQGTGVAEIARATLEAVCFQTKDLLVTLQKDLGEEPPALCVDGGMAANDWLLQRLADLVGLPVERPVVGETTALGAAFPAGIGSGLYTDSSALAARRKLDRRFEPGMTDDETQSRFRCWVSVVEGVRHMRLGTGVPA